MERMGMDAQANLRSTVRELHSKFSALPEKELEPERRAEDFLRPLFEKLGWDWLSREVAPQKPVKSGTRTTRVDYAFRRSGDVRPSFYVEVKRASNNLTDPKDVQQALDYGKNSNTRWVVLTNFFNWRVFNSDFFDNSTQAELFEFTLEDCLTNDESLSWLALFARENDSAALDDYAKRHKKWKESESVEELLTEQLVQTRVSLSKAINDQNHDLFDPEPESEEIKLEACVQHVLNRLIFCRMLEDNGADPERRMKDAFTRWQADKRAQFYRDFLCPYWAEMRKKYDSTIFDNHRIDGLSIKNEDFVPLFESYYVNPKTKLLYRFEAIGTDILGHAYENYLSYKARPTGKNAKLDKELFKRKQSGIYYTPDFLVEHLVRATLGEKLKTCKTPEDALRLKVIDPACGSGTFLVGALREFKQWHDTHSKKNGGTATPTSDFLHAVIERCLYGLDLDPAATRLAKLNLFLHVADAPRQLPKPNILRRNSLVWDADDRDAFILERDFPLVVEAGGFDVVIGNPPWEKWKPDSQEFFEPYEPGFMELPTQAAKAKIEEILKTRPSVRKLWHDNVAHYSHYSDLWRDTYRFQSGDVEGKKKSGDLDLYKLFTERAYQLLKTGGSAGLVLPSGIYTDLGAKGLRAMLVDHTRLKGLYSFENRNGVFPDVDSRYKFALTTFEKDGKTKEFPCAFFLYDADDLTRAVKQPTVLTVEFVKRSSPTSWNVLEIKTPQDKTIVEKLLKHPSIGEEIKGVWNVSTQSGFHMTSDANLFKTGNGLLGGVPMLEGKNIHQFTHQFAEAPVPRYKILEKDVLTSIKPEKQYFRGYWMAFRGIARSNDNRTFISTLVPPGYVCGNSINIVRLPSVKPLSFLVGVMNSFVIDYFMRQKVSANINMFYFLEAPVPRLSSGKEFDAIVKKVVQLVAVSDEFVELKKETGVSHAVKSESDRAQVRAELDALVAKLYGLTRDELAFVLDKFPLVDSKQKNLVLDAFGG